jgi:hypothetical protein
MPLVKTGISAMTIETLYYFAGIFSALAVFASLIFVGLQVRQNTVQSRQATNLARAELTVSVLSQSNQFLNSWYDTEEVAEFMNRALFTEEPLTRNEKSRLSIRLATFVSNAEMTFILYQKGLAEPEMYTRMTRSLGSYFKLPRVRKWWTRHRIEFYQSTEFGKYIDTIIVDILANQKAHEDNDAATPKAESETGK